MKCMANEVIVRGTTPTIEFRLKVVDPSSIVAADLSISQGGDIVVEKDLSSMTIAENKIQWILSQSDTLKLKSGGKCKIQVRCRTSSGLAYASYPIEPTVMEIIKDGEI